MNVYANDYAACVLWVCACVRFTFMCIRSLAKLCWHSIFGVWKVLLSLFISHTEYFSAGITVARTHRFGAGYCFHFVHSDSFIHSILAAGYGPFGIISSPSLSFIHIKYVCTYVNYVYEVVISMCSICFELCAVVKAKMRTKMRAATFCWWYAHQNSVTKTWCLNRHNAKRTCMHCIQWLRRQHQ